MQENEREFYKQRDHNISVVGKAIRVHTCYRQIYFSFKKYGSEATALKAARSFRDRLPVGSFRGLYDHDKCPARGESGIVGVLKYMRQGDQVGWVASWQEGIPPDRIQRRRYFLFSDYGDQTLAVAARCRKEMVRLHSIANSYRKPGDIRVAIESSNRE